jgi:hypothetical protein
MFDTTVAVLTALAFFAFTAWRWWSFALVRTIREERRKAGGL